MTRDAKGRFVKRQPTSVPVTRGSNLNHGSSLPPTFRSSWPYFAALILVAAAWHYASLLVSLVAIVVGPFVLLGWLAPRYPVAASIVYAFIIGIITSFGGGGYYYRRGRWW